MTWWAEISSSRVACGHGSDSSSAYCSSVTWNRPCFIPTLVCGALASWNSSTSRRRMCP